MVDAQAQGINYTEGIELLRADILHYESQGNLLEVVKAKSELITLLQQSFQMTEAERELKSLDGYRERVMNIPEASLLILLENSEVEDDLLARDAMIKNIKDLISSNPDLRDVYWGQSLLAEGYAHLYDEQFDSCNAVMQQAIAEGQRTKNQLVQGEAYLHWAKSLRRQGNFPRAIELIKESLRLYESHFGPINTLVASACNDLALAYIAQKDLVSADRYLRRAMAIRLQLFGKQSVPYTRIVNNVILNLEKMGQYDEALPLARENIAAIESMDQKDPTFHPASYATLGQILTKQGALEDAKKNYEKSVALFRSYQPESPRIRFYLRPLAGICSRLGLHEESLQFTHESMAAVVQNLDLNDVYDNPDLESPYSYNSLKFLTAAKAAAWSRLYEHQSHDTTHLREAIKLYKLADHFVGKNRTKTNYQPSRLSYSATNQSIYEGAIKNLIELHSISQQKKDLSDAFQLIEKTKSVTLLEDLLEASARNKIDLPVEYLQEETIMLDSLQHIRKNLSSEKNTEAINKWETARLNVELKYQNFQKQIRKEFPRYYQARYDLKFLALQELQNWLGEDQSVLEYYQGQNTLYAFHISREEVELRSIPSAGLEDQIDSLVEAMKKYDATAVSDTANKQAISIYQKYAYAVHQRLIAPFSNLRKHLMIVPDGALNYLPFEVLLRQMPSSNEAFAAYPYLIHDHIISYNYSSTLAAQMEELQVKRPLQVLAVAPSFEGGLLQPLAFNVEEAQAVVDILGGEILKGPSATRTSFTRSAQDYGAFHFASHAVVDAQDSDQSYLAFYENAEQEDHLFLNEVYSLSLPAHLVTLSACETNAGELQSGESIASLARGFSYAGAKSLITSLWDVTDISAKDIMQEFYQGLSQKEPKDVALRNAKLTYLDDAESALAHPYFWSTFIAIGHMAPLQEQSRLIRIFSVTMLVSLLLLGFWFIMKRIL